MEKITQVTTADVGRIAVSVDRPSYNYRVRYLGPGIEPELASVEHLFADNRLSYRSEVFKIESGAFDMYWEDEMEPKKPQTLFEIWCADKGYDPKGEFVYDQEASDKVHCFSFGKDSVLKIVLDDNSRCPRFSDKRGNTKFEYFNYEERGVVLKQYVKAAKPRFHKKRQKPPVRQKTDVVIKYKTGQTYTIKSVDGITLDEQFVSIGVSKEVTKGVHANTTNVLDVDLVQRVLVKTPEGEYALVKCQNGEWLVNSQKLFVICAHWSQNF